MQYRRHERQQAGLRRPQTTTGLIAQARTRGANYHLEEIEGFYRLYDKLGTCQAHFPGAEYARKELERKILHLSQVDAQLPAMRVAADPEEFSRRLSTAATGVTRPGGTVSRRTW